MSDDTYLFVNVYEHVISDSQNMNFGSIISLMYGRDNRRILYRSLSLEDAYQRAYDWGGNKPGFKGLSVRPVYPYSWYSDGVFVGGNYTYLSMELVGGAEGSSNVPEGAKYFASMSKEKYGNTYSLFDHCLKRAFMAGTSLDFWTHHRTVISPGYTGTRGLFDKVASMVVEKQIRPVVRTMLGRNGNGLSKRMVSTLYFLLDRHYSQIVLPNVLEDLGLVDEQSIFNGIDFIEVSDRWSAYEEYILSMATNDM